MTGLARAGLAAVVVTAVQLAGALSVLAFIPASGSDADGLVLDLGVLVLVIMAGVSAICVAPAVMLAVMVWRLERFRTGMLVVTAALLAWHVVGTAIAAGWWPSDIGFALVVPGPAAVTVGYQALMVAALAVVTVMLATARGERREPVPAVWFPPMDDRPGPQFGAYQARHR